MLTKQFAILYISFVVLTKCLSCAKFQGPIKYDNLPQQQAFGTYSHAALKLGYNIVCVVKPHFIRHSCKLTTLFRTPALCFFCLTL
jgi:hypothetical protein